MLGEMTVGHAKISDNDYTHAVLAEQLYVHTEHSMVEVILRHSGRTVVPGAQHG